VRYQKGSHLGVECKVDLFVTVAEGIDLDHELLRIKREVVDIKVLGVTASYDYEQTCEKAVK
jgi:hypothetical protein